MVCILTAILRAQQPEIDGDAAVMVAIKMSRSGIGETELADAIDTVLGGLPPSSEIMHDVDYALAVRAATNIKHNC